MRGAAVLVRLLIACALVASAFGGALAAESTTGAIAGSVVNAQDAPLAGAAVVAASASGRYTAQTDARGRFTMLGIDAGTYAVSAEAHGFAPAVRAGVIVLPGETQRITFRLSASALSTGLRSIGSVRSRAGSFAVGSSAATFAVSGAAARAAASANGASGLAAYTAGTVQGAIASVPGVQQDSFANAILRGGKVDDTLFDFDSVPVPQGLIAEPGGNVVGAQLPSTGIATTTVTLAGYQAEGDNALGGIVDQIPAVGTYPGRTAVELTQGAPYRGEQLSVSSVWATPDLRWRYAFAATTGSRDFAYGDGHTFYPAEAGTYGLALARRSGSSASSNVHFRPRPGDDISLTALVAQASYDQYGTPYPGETYGAFGPSTAFGRDPNAPVTAPARVRGTLDVVKAAVDAHVAARGHAAAGVPLAVRFRLRRAVLGRSVVSRRADLALGVARRPRRGRSRTTSRTRATSGTIVKFGAGYRTSTTFLDELVPTANERVRSRPTIFSSLAYLGDTWSISPRLDVSATARFTSAHVVPSDGFIYDVSALDPHASAVYRIGNDLAARVTFDHTTVAPKPLQADRTDSTGSTAFVPLGPETQNALTYALEGGGPTQFRLTYFTQRERNRIDVLPVNFRSVVNQGQSPSAVGVPTNAGELRASGVDAWLHRGRVTFSATALRGFSSSASQFAFNGLNAAAVEAGHLFPLGYVPDVSAEPGVRDPRADSAARHAVLSYESGYRYGNGTAIVDVRRRRQAGARAQRQPRQPRLQLLLLARSVAAVRRGRAIRTSDRSARRKAPIRTRCARRRRRCCRCTSKRDRRRDSPWCWTCRTCSARRRRRSTRAIPYLIGPPGYAGGDPPTRHGTASSKAAAVRARQRRADIRRQHAGAAVDVRPCRLRAAELSGSALGRAVTALPALRAARRYRRYDVPSAMSTTAPAHAARQLHPLFVGELTGVDLRALHDRAELDEIKALMDRYAVLVVRDQPFADDEQAAFARRLDGELVTKVARSVIDSAARLKEPGLTDISNLDENDRILDAADRRRMYSLGNRLWHSDSSFQSPPARYSMLSAKAVPDAGGETEYADMRAAYDALPDALKTQIEDLRAFHSIIYSRSTIGFTEFSDAERAQFPGAEQPLVRVAPGLRAQERVRRVARLARDRLARPRRPPAAARADGARDAAAVRLPPHVAHRRLRDLGQPLHDAPRPAVRRDDAAPRPAPRDDDRSSSPIGAKPRPLSHVKNRISRRRSCIILPSPHTIEGMMNAGMLPSAADHTGRAFAVARVRRRPSRPQLHFDGAAGVADWTAAKVLVEHLFARSNKPHRQRRVRDRLPARAGATPAATSSTCTTSTTTRCRSRSPTSPARAPKPRSMPRW